MTNSQKQTNVWRTKERRSRPASFPPLLLCLMLLRGIVSRRWRWRHVIPFAHTGLVCPGILTSALRAIGEFPWSRRSAGSVVGMRPRALHSGRWRLPLIAMCGMSHDSRRAAWHVPVTILYCCTPCKRQVATHTQEHTHFQHAETRVRINATLRNETGPN